MKDVSQCPSDCTSDEYYNEEEGKCKPRNVLLNCPPGNCCINGGSYKEEVCNNNLICCTSGGYTGKCMEKCGEVENEGDKLSGITGAAIGGRGSTGIIIVIIAIILIGGAIAFYVVRSKVAKPTLSKEVSSSFGHCTKCGSPLKEGSAFCTKCGKKL
jgi:hypothetical protein